MNYYLQKKTKISIFLSILVVTSIVCQSSTSEVIPTDSSGSSPASPQEHGGKTNSEGKVEILLPSDQIVGIQVEDFQTGESIPEVDVSLLSKEDDILLIASDTSDRYAPLIMQVEESELIGCVSSQISGKMNAPSGQIIEALTIALVAWSYFETANDWYVYYQDLPDLEEWGFLSSTYCANTDQIIQGLKAVVGTGFLFTPSDEILGSIKFLKPFRELAEFSFLTQVAEKIGQDILGNQFEILANNTPAIMQWKKFNVPVYSGQLIQPIIPIGWCLEPLDKSDKTSILVWMKYSFEKKNSWVIESLTKNKIVKYFIPIPFDPEGNLVLEEISLKDESLVDYINASWQDSTSCKLHALDNTLENIENWGGTLNWGVLVEPWTNESLGYESVIFSFELDTQTNEFHLDRLWLGGNGDFQLGIIHDGEPMQIFRTDLRKCD